jgi:fatty acid desaturase
MKSVIPENEFPRIRRNAWLFILVYVFIAIVIISGFSELLWYLVIPLILGRPVMLLFGLIQHVEMSENSPSILESTRSFRTNPIVEFLYMNMNHHVEHHLYPQVPFYSLPQLHQEIKHQLPEPDPGFWRTNIEALSVVIRRSLCRNTKAWTIRQAPHMITQGGHEKVSSKSMR